MEQAIKHLQKDEILATIMREIPYPVIEKSDNLYLMLVRSIAFQQLSGKAATTIFNRFLLLFPNSYPHPHLLANTDIALLRGVGFSYQKSNYVRNIAQFSLENDLEKNSWDNWSDDALIKHLTQIKGVGTWTVQMLLMFSMAREDVFPALDLAIQQAMSQLYGLDYHNKKSLQKSMEEIAKQWQPYRSVASHYLWRWWDTKKGSATF